MESVASIAPSNFQFQQATIHSFPSPSKLSLPHLRRRTLSTRGVSFAVSIRSDGAKIGQEDSCEFDLLQRPIAAAAAGGVGGGKSGKEYEGVLEEREWVDWEDKILEETVPLVGLARMILHSGKYKCGDRLRPAHQKVLLKRLLPYHPDCDKKIGTGVDYITIGYHPEFEDTRCFFIVRKDGEKVDFSYWKCIKGLIRKKYPLYADTFMQRHFQRRTRSDSTGNPTIVGPPID